MRRELMLGLLSRCRVPMLFLVLTACASHQVDWTARVGNYTHDQAVHDLGPAEKQTKLEDGTLVAEWHTQRGHSDTYHNASFTGRPYSQDYRLSGNLRPVPVTTSTPDVFLKLTFDAAGRLTNWKEVIVPYPPPLAVPP